MAPNADGDIEEDQDPVLRTWSANDMLFHTRSVMGRDDGNYGATFAHAAQIKPQPAVKNPPSGPVVPLRGPTSTNSWTGTRRSRPRWRDGRSVREYGGSGA
ncbi:hypothetical protein SALBM311S_01500 [Streptomyces alboniger]